jgi:hypothetical protein
VGQAYLSGVENFESSLKEYPKFFFDSSQAVRLQKYEDLVAQFKKIEWLFINLHPKQAYSTFLRPFNATASDKFCFLAFKDMDTVEMKIAIAPLSAFAFCTTCLQVLIMRNIVSTRN